MAVTLKVHDIKGKEVGDFSYTPFKEELSGAMLAQVLRVYVTNQHQGTRKAKNRGELKRPDTKPWKQKGTGRARHGSKNSPIWVGGGVTFAPRPHQRRLSLPVSLKRKAMRYFLDTEIAEGGVVLFDVPTKVVKTKDAVSFIDAVNSFKLPVVLVLQEKDDRTANAFRNIEKVTIRRANLISPHDMSKKALYVFDKNALATLVQRVTKNAS